MHAYDFEVDGIYYNKLSDSSVEVTFKDYDDETFSIDNWCKTLGDNSYSGSVTIPSTVAYNGNTYSVVSIGEGAFAKSCDMTDVSIPTSVTEIGFGAFFYCSGLTTINIPDAVTTIGSGAFYECI